MVALRYLRSRRQDGFISVIAWFSLLGICLGVGTLIIVMSVMNGFRIELLSRVLGLNGHVTVYADHGPMPDYGDVVQRIRAVPGVVTVTPQLQGQVMAMANGRASGALVRGMTGDDLVARRLIPDNIVAGSIGDFTDGVVMGDRLAERLAIGVGDRVRLISPVTTTTVIGSVPRIRAFRVAGLFNVGMFEYDNSFVYVPLAQAQLFFRSGEAVNAIEVMVNAPDRVERFREPLATATGDDLRVVSWKRQNASFFNALQVERNVMFLILTLIILVAGFNIISSMIMMVNDKRSAIAVMRTMGASRGMVTRVFFLAGASVGVIGTVAGSVLGLVFCANIESIRRGLESLTGGDLFSAEIYFLSRLPAVVDPMEVVLVVALALSLSLGASIYPSWRAARIDPVEVLRHG
ncbi:MAG: lipoprotein-releasing ABC transporter permease subunit [Alphaproteobacteria bacterium]|nr:lipoprotein-releasing ABC transporter permease subunit [Alphaproteobacteria bacterium]